MALKRGDLETSVGKFIMNPFVLNNFLFTLINVTKITYIYIYIYIYEIIKGLRLLSLPYTVYR